MRFKTKILQRDKGLRFSLESDPFSFNANSQTGQALVSNISPSGFLARNSTIGITQGETIRVNFEFICPRTPLTLDALVVRSDGKEFAGKFFGIAAENHKKLVKFFTRELNKTQMFSLFY